MFTIASLLVSSTARKFRTISKSANSCSHNRFRVPTVPQRNFTKPARRKDKGTMDGSSHHEDGQKFKGRSDCYNGVTVDSSQENCPSSNFAERLKKSLKQWSTEKKSTIWFRVDLSNADWIPVLAKEGFRFHHARESFAMMYKWLPTEVESNIPAYAHTNIGVGGFVLDDATNEILIVKDKHSILSGPPRWKLPGGIVDPGETIPEAVIREVQEETGVLTEFVSLIGFRHAHDYAFECSDIYLIARLRPLTREIRKCEREIIDCTWRKLEDYANDPNITQNNRILVQAMLQYAEDRVGLELVEGTHPVTKKPVFIYMLPPV